MATAWTLTRERIADRALERCRRLGAGQTPSSEDRALAIEELDAILKELPSRGLVWPRLTPAASSLVVSTGTQTVSLPADYVGDLVMTMIGSDGYEHDFPLIQTTEWSGIENKALTGNDPTKGWISPSNVLNVWPVPTRNVTFKLFYSRMYDDTVASTAPGVTHPMIGMLSYWVAERVGDTFGLPESRIQRFRAVWEEGLSRAINAQIPQGPIRITAEQ